MVSFKPLISPKIVKNHLFVKAAALYSDTAFAAVNLQQVTQEMFFSGQHNIPVGRDVAFDFTVLSRNITESASQKSHYYLQR